MESSAEAQRITEADMQKRFMIYDVGNKEEWINRAEERKNSLRGQAASIEDDISIWLPKGWPIKKDIMRIIECAENAIIQGINIVKKIDNSPSSDVVFPI